MSKRLELCLIFFVGCTLNSSPIRDGSTSVDHTPDDRPSTGTISNAEEREDAAVRDASTAEGDPISTGSAGSDSDDTSTQPDASTNAPAAGAPAKTPAMSTMPKTPPQTATDAGKGGQAGDVSASGGSGGTSGASGMAAAGTGGAGGEPNLRGTLVDQVFDAFQERGEGTVEIAMLLNDLRVMAATGKDLSAPFVLSLLNAMKKSGICLADRQSCAGICATIGQDCKQCMADAMCKSALTEVCGPIAVGCIFGQ